MLSGIVRRALRRYSDKDALAQQRAWVLLLANLVGFGLACGVSLFTLLYQGYPANSPDVWIGLVIAGAMVVSIILLTLGWYQAAAHFTIALTLAAIWVLILTKTAPSGRRSEIVYVIAILALPSLLLGRFWTVFYGTVSMALLGVTTGFIATMPGENLKDALGLAVDIATGIIFVVFVTALMTRIYEATIRRVRELLADQRSKNTALLDLTASLERSEAQKRQFYRETIYSVTRGKLNIVDRSAIDPLLETAECDLPIVDAASVSASRQAICQFCKEQGLAGNNEEMFCIAVGEAITNAIKHAGGGRLRCGVQDESLWVAISDDGPGIESLLLPRALLMAGFSTKPSLGLGYTLMLEVADKIMLNTSERGTIVVLMKTAEGTPGPVGLAAWPDTWDTIDA